MSTIPKILIVYFSLAIFTAPSLSFGIEAPKTEYNIEELFQKSCQTPNLTEKQHLREQMVIFAEDGFFKSNLNTIKRKRNTKKQ